MLISFPDRMDTSQAATYVGLSASTINKLRLYGGGAPYSKIGSRVIYSRADLDTWMSSHKRFSTSEVNSDV